MQQAQDLYSRGGFEITPYAGDWVANADPATTAGQNGILGLGPAGNLNPTIDAISGLATSSANRAMAGPNFNFDPQRQAVIDSIMPAINGTFAGSGMTGSSLHAANLSKGLSAGLADAEMGFRDQEMRAQQQAYGQATGAAGMLPGFMSAQAGYDRQPFVDQIMVGGQRQAQGQAEIDANMQRHLLSQGSEANALRDYVSMLMGVGQPFGTSTATQQTRLGPMGILGGGLQIAGMWKDL